MVTLTAESTRHRTGQCLDDVIRRNVENSLISRWPELEDTMRRTEDSIAEADVDDHDVEIDIFQEPEGFRQEEKPASFAEHTLSSGEVLKVRLVGFNPLWVRSVFLLALFSNINASLREIPGALLIPPGPPSLECRTDTRTLPRRARSRSCGGQIDPRTRSRRRSSRPCRCDE